MYLECLKNSIIDSHQMTFREDGKYLVHQKRSEKWLRLGMDNWRSLKSSLLRRQNYNRRISKNKSTIWRELFKVSIIIKIWINIRMLQKSLIMLWNKFRSFKRWLKNTTCRKHCLIKSRRIIVRSTPWLRLLSHIMIFGVVPTNLRRVLNNGWMMISHP